MKTALTSAIALAIGAGGLCVTTASHADSSAAQKLGQIGVINQTLQPKPAKSSPAYSNSISNSTSAGANYGNTTNGVNGQSPANAATNAGATARAGAAAGNAR
ncbi:conserved exported hypothetical protein [Burkholderia sp. 8Y]|uniref:hypothetical protein n=1 Tax=Burkholderia sp. 8Y TaxID=2653133 RepID=UPI0012F2CD65|nr:hypothetical protein [Burkholderia sp. 8Y]VXB05761.1 conserved exported hypothetical protein [Burkholderia sp. 8Y]